MSVLLFRVALLAHPRRLGRRYGGEMEETFHAAVLARGRRGRWKALAYTLRAVADVARSGWGERPGPRVVIDGWWVDVRVAVRALWKTPGFTASAAVILALGIGANAAVFSALKATLLTPPPYPHPDRLVLLEHSEVSDGQPLPGLHPWSYREYQALAGARNMPLEASAAYSGDFVTLSGVGEATFLVGEEVTPDYLGVLGLKPALGRDFIASDDVDGAPPVALLGYGLWQERFGADPSVLGRAVRLNEHAVTVVGVAPEGFHGLSGNAGVFFPVHTAATLTPYSLSMRVIGRLAPGASLAALKQHMPALGKTLAKVVSTGDPRRVPRVSAAALSSARVNGQARRSVLILSAAAALLLLVTCANLAGLLLARANARTREAAVRVAVGAGRWRVARGLLIEAMLLAATGGVAALLVACVGARALAAAWPARFLNGSWQLRGINLSAVSVDGRVVAFAAALTLVVGLLFGALPALMVSQVSPARQLRSGTAGRRRARRGLDLRSALVSAEVALALVLLVGAGLLIRSLEGLDSVERGFQPGHLVTFWVQLPPDSHWVNDVGGFDAQLLEKLRALRGVRSVAVTCITPLSGSTCAGAQVSRAGDHTWSEESAPSIGIDYVSDDFFKTLGVAVHRGRTFTPADRKGSPLVVVLSESVVRELFPDGHALGRTISLAGDPYAPKAASSAEVVGVVGDVLYGRLQDSVWPEAYIDARQEAGPARIVARTRGDPLSMIPAARAAVATLEPDASIYNVSTDAQWEASATSETRVMSELLTLFAALALLLACTGVWAVVAYTVTRHTSELGVRVALGAGPGQVVGLVVRGGLGIAAVGAVLGALGAWSASRVLRSFLYEVAPTDPRTFVAAAALLVMVAGLAAWLPARRATRADPMVALRVE